MHSKDLQPSPLFSKDDIERELPALSFGGSLEYLAEVENESKAILLSVALNTTTQGSQAPNGTFTDIEAPKSFELPLQPKAKTKSRPAASIVPTNMGNEKQLNVEECEPSLAPDLAVKPESLRVFLRMFPSTAEEYSAKPLDWKSFVRAMQDVGFPAEQSGGSAVTFSKDGLGRIVFHKPHPVAKIEQTILQSWGKRLGKWFSWRRDTFVAAK